MSNTAAEASQAQALLKHHRLRNTGMDGVPLDLGAYSAGLNAVPKSPSLRQVDAAFDQLDTDGDGKPAAAPFLLPIHAHSVLCVSSARDGKLPQLRCCCC